MGLLCYISHLWLFSFPSPGPVPALVFSASQGGRSLRQWTKRGVFEIYTCISGMFFHGLFYLHFYLFLRECGETWGREINKTEHGSSLTCIFFLFFLFSFSFFLSFLGFNGWLAFTLSLYVLYHVWVGVGVLCILHVGEKFPPSSSSFSWKLSVSLYFYHTVLLAS